MTPRDTLVLGAIQLGYTASLAPSWNKFVSAANSLEDTQSQKLNHFLTHNAQTAYGREYRYGSIQDVKTFQDRVPIVDYDALEPYVMRAARGESNVLCPDPIKMFECSSGSTSATKLIPYTDGLLSEFSAATNAWLFNIFSQNLSLMGTQSYWSVSPSARERGCTEGGIPVGFEDDTEYFSPIGRWALRKMMAVPGTVARIHDMDAWRRTTALHLLRADRLGFISIWSPTFLTLMMGYIEAELDNLLTELGPVRAGAIRAALDTHGQLVGQAIWPKLGLISCWTDGYAKTYVPGLRRWFPTTPIQSKGLLATEGVVSIPLQGAAHGEFTNILSAGALASRSHFFEFIDLDHPDARPKLAHELVAGASYSPLLTTANGFARYHLKDTVECVGWQMGLPFIRFSGKLDKTSDLCGEKLTAGMVDQAFVTASSKTGIQLDFALLAPVEGEPPFYEAYIESSADDGKLEQLARCLEDELLNSYHYKYCRDLGQLGPVRVMRVQDGWQTFESTLIGYGQRSGNIKPVHLDARTTWCNVYNSNTRSGENQWN